MSVHKTRGIGPPREGVYAGLAASPEGVCLLLPEREDEDLREKLEKQLAILCRQGLIEIWDKGDIAAGADQPAPPTPGSRRLIILLLISPDFLASDYVGGVELERAMARHEARTALVVPVILRPCLWKHGDFAKLQALPTDGEPVTSDKWPSQDAAFLAVAEGIERAIEDQHPRDERPRWRRFRAAPRRRFGVCLIAAMSASPGAKGCWRSSTRH